MLEILVYTFIIIIFVGMNVFAIKHILKMRALKALSDKYAKELSEQTRKAIRIGIEPSHHVITYTKLEVFIISLGWLAFFLVLFYEGFTNFFTYIFVMLTAFHNRYNVFFDILPEGLIVKTQLVKWKDISSYELINITPNHKYYGYEFEINHSKELVIKLNDQNNSTISLVITDHEVEKEITSLLQDNGIEEEKNSYDT